MAKVALAGTLRAAEDLGRVPALLAAARPAFETFLDHRGDWGVAGCQVLAARVAMSLEDGLAVTVQRSGDANGSEAMYRQVVAECPHIDSKSPHQLATHDFGGSPAADH
jgi:hypothetical protein